MQIPFIILSVKERKQMGLIKAALGAAGGVMADQWLEYF